jgi:hypothetical protein
VGESIGTYSVLVEKPKRRRLLGRPRHRWENNIKMDVRDVGWGHGLDRSVLGLGQVAGSFECGNDLSGSIKFGEVLEWLKTC